MGNVFFITKLKGIGIYALALFITRNIGTKLISQMNFFDFIMSVSMGSIVARAIINERYTTLYATTALILFAILDKKMKKMKLTINELKMKLREKDAFHLSEVEFVIMETDGNLSALLKSDKKPLTPLHMNIQTTSSGLEKDIIIDGTIIEENLTSAGLDKEWLTSELNKQNIKDCSVVFYAGVDNTKKLYVSKIKSYSFFIILRQYTIHLIRT